MMPLETTTKTIHLHQLISKLVSNYQAVAVIQKSFFMNEVSPGLLVATNQEALNNLLGSLFYLVARCSNEACISVYASVYDDRVALNIKDTSSSGNYGVLYEFQHLQLFARQIGGFLEINNYRNKETTISFNFENHLPAEKPVIKELKIA